MALGQIDYHLFKPWKPVERILYPAVAEFLAAWDKVYEPPSVALRSKSDGRTEVVPAAGLFVMIGADPNTQWLEGTLARDEQGYILTGQDLIAVDSANGWPLERAPHLLETSIPGVFAVGDVRHRSVKRVASAVGAGAIALQLVHTYLEDLAALRAERGGVLTT